MGALSFAVDTIHSLSAVFAQKHEPRSHINLKHLDLELDDSARRIFKEFSTGMQMLYKHGSRNPCSVPTITSENLKLLYSNLKANSSFKRAIARIKQNSGGNPNWVWLPLISDKLLTAGIIYLPENYSLTPYLKHTNLTAWQHIPGTPSVVTTDRYSPRQLFVSLSGNTQLNLMNKSAFKDRLLKTGDVFAEPYNTPIIDRISSRQGNSLVLNVQLTSAV